MIIKKDNNSVNAGYVIYLHASALTPTQTAHPHHTQQQHQHPSQQIQHAQLHITH